MARREGSVASGTFDGLVVRLLKIFKGRSKAVIIPIFLALIGLASSTIGVFEEMFPFIPIFVGIAIAMGYDSVVGMAIVVIGCGLGYSGAFMNPFTVGTAQAIAEIPIMSGNRPLICPLSMLSPNNPRNRRLFRSCTESG